METNSQQRLRSKLLAINNNKIPVKLWTLHEVLVDLAEVLKQPNVSFLPFTGAFVNRTVGDSLHAYGFQIEVTENESFRISW